MKDEPLIEKELYKIIEKAGNEALNTEKFQKMEAQEKINDIFEQVCLNIIKINFSNDEWRILINF
jgi:hypothetical protein